MTPEALVAATQDPVAAEPAQGASVRVSWAFFSSPSAFVVDLRTPGQATPIRLQMDFRDGGWQVTRVWLPPEVLGRANARYVGSIACGPVHHLPERPALEKARKVVHEQARHDGSRCGCPPPMCGSTMMRSVVQNGCSTGSGSWRNTSSTAPAIRLD